MRLNIKSIFKIIFSLLFILTLFGCKKNDKFNQKRSEGYKISIRYESNGGTYLDREGITLIDMFNPNDYEKDSNGNIHIKLIEPTDPSRPSGGSEGIYITKSDSFLVGWYKEKTIKLNSDSKPINESGEALVLVDNKYYLESDKSTLSEPAYSYSGYWDFDNDYLEYNDSMGEYELTLYAKWSTYFEFRYYYQDGTEWKYLGNTSFDYKTTNQTGSQTFDKDTIWLPSYVSGAMNYNHKYNNNSMYQFPKLQGYTFSKAYLDKEMTNEITDSYEHTGSINFETGEAVDPIVNIYCLFDKGEYYHISSAKELVDNPNLNGIYEIEADLDFEGLNWPTMFSYGTFNGKIYSKDNQNYKLSNISVFHANSSTSVKNGGVFGTIGENASIESVEFNNVTFDLADVGRRNKDTNFGLLSGYIENKESISNVKLSGTIKIGNITIGDNYSINLIANGDNNENVLVDGVIHLIIYGQEQIDVYSYTVNPESVEVDESGYITFESVTGLKLNEASYAIR